MKIRPHIEAQGRPKHTSTLWPLKIERNRNNYMHVHEETENLSIAKKTCVDMEASLINRRIGGPGDPA